jgi:hypothetical protein
MTIKIRLNDECKNGHQDFAITADIYEKGKPKIDKYCIMGGCCHDEILAAKPDLQIFVDLHLCDYKGIPVQAVENGFYHLREGFNDIKPDSPKFKSAFIRYYRMTEPQFDILNTSANKLQYAIHLKELGILAQWEMQANEAIKQLEEMTGQKFLNTSQRTQYHAPTPEQLKEEEEKQKSGYYSHAAIELRRKAAEDKIMFDLLEEKRSKINKIETEYAIKAQVLTTGGKKALDNCIYYDHTKQLAFNWRSYDCISNELIAKIIAEIKLPEGVTIENKEGKQK